jgi:hypothetical protein
MRHSTLVSGWEEASVRNQCRHAGVFDPDFLA